MILHGYFRSSASWRVRIGLALKGLAIEQLSLNLREGEQSAPAFLKVNPQGLVPTLVLDDGTALIQSLAILEYLDETVPDPALLPKDPIARARVRAASQIIACDVHPLQNLKVLRRVSALTDDDTMKDWARTTIEDGLGAFAKLIESEVGPFCFGETPNLADICLIPQVYNARRFGANWSIGRLAAIESACMAQPSFFLTRPEAQSDSE